jgi:hypothetical protein
MKKMSKKIDTQEFTAFACCRQHDVIPEITRKTNHGWQRHCLTKSTARNSNTCKF